MCSLLTAPRGLTPTLWTLAAAAVLAVTAPAPAQFGLAGGIGDAFRPAFTTRDIQLAEQMLDLDEAQRFILETLYEDYDAEFRTGVDSFRERVSAMRTEIDPANPDPGQIMRIVFGSIDEWRDESKVLAEQFIADLRGLLNDEQLQSWPPFERRLFRLKYLRNGQLPAENLDLTTHVQDLKLDGVKLAEIQPLLLQYEQELHEALRSREAYLQASQGELISAIQVNNYEVGIEVAQRQVALRKGVRDVNETYTLAIAAALPEDVGASFVEKIRLATYPRVYRLVPAQRSFEAAKELEGISEETLQAIIALERDFLNELDMFNEHLVQLIRGFEPDKIRIKVEQAASRLSGQTPQTLQDPTRPEFAKRREISNRYMDLLKALLTPEQFASLPGARRWLSPEEREALGEAPATKRNAIPRKMLRAPGAGERGDAVPAIVGKDNGATGKSAGGQKEDEGKQNEAPRR
ncbi:MAG: hypothetical protein ACYTA3_03015 [Planctomycetota bacterium]|jgi:hypothetical protein